MFVAYRNYYKYIILKETLKKILLKTYANVTVMSFTFCFLFALEDGLVYYYIIPKLHILYLLLVLD